MDEPLPEPDPLTSVRTWRELQAIELGCSPVAAGIFALSNGSHASELRDLIERGCPPDVAADILSD